MINIYNESSLHKTLKVLKAEENKGETEVTIDKYICDVVVYCTNNKHTKEKQNHHHIFEIQTHNLGKLTKKILHLKKNNTVTLVYPLPIKTFIETSSETGIFLSRRKSPKDGTIYSLFDELTGITPLLEQQAQDDTSFILEVIPITRIEKRIRTKEAVQLKNKSRRFLRNWYKKDTCLENVFESHFFYTKKDYLKLLPSTLQKEFSAKDVYNEIQKEKSLSKQKQKDLQRQIGKMLWTFRKSGFIKVIHKKGNAFIYTLS